MKIIVDFFKSETMQAWREWNEILVLKTVTTLEFCIWRIYPLKWLRNKDFLSQTKTKGGILGQQTCPPGNVKSVFRVKENGVRNLDLHKEKKSVREGMDEWKIKSVFYS